MGWPWTRRDQPIFLFGKSRPPRFFIEAAVLAFYWMGISLMSHKQTHLELIQGIVNRLSNNSFLLKGWSVILISGLFALAAKDTNKIFIYLAYFPCIVFWALDGYFLWQERLYRALYNKVRKLSEKNIDYSMDTSSVQDEASWIGAFFSVTLIPFHGTILLAIVIIMIVLSR